MLEPQSVDMIQMMKIEILQLMETAKSYKEKIETSKTKPKLDLYSKKLEKNNKKLMTLLLSLDKLSKRLGD